MIGVAAKTARWWGQRVAVGILALAVGWKYVHDARLTAGFISHQPPGYYGLLTDAFFSGQLNLKVKVDPKLLQLANPYAGPQGALRPHDMSYYRGKFYLYYGVTPVVILLLPWRILTGTFLTEMAATTFFCYGGFLLGAAWLLNLKRRFYPDRGWGWTLLAIAVFGFGTPVFSLSANPTFYAVPIAAAFFCLMTVAILVERAMCAADAVHAAAWLSAASLMHGLAVGARPDYVLSVVLLLLPAVWLWRKLPRESRFSWTGTRIWIAAVVPAAAVGGLLALYNYRRFGNPFDFGMQYSMSSGDMRGAKLLGWEFIGKNLELYLAKAADFVPFYPFVYTDWRPYGIMPHLPLAALALLFPLVLLSRRLRQDASLLVTSGFLVGSALLNFGVLCLFFGGEARYLVDFVPFALLLAGALLLILGGSLSTPSMPRRLAAVATAVIAGWTLVNGICLGLENRVQTTFTRQLERGTNTAAALVEKWRGVQYGPIEMNLQLPLNAVGQKEPLLTTGTMAGTGDIIYLRYTDPQHVQVGFFHLGIGGPLSEPVALDYRNPHRLILRLGSLYPPQNYPVFRQWSDAEVARLRRRLEVTLDGQSILKADVDIYPTTPDAIYVGSNPVAPDVCRAKFTGKILQVSRLSVTKPDAPAPSTKGPVQLQLLFPTTLGGPAMPLICTGRPGAGDVLWVQMLRDGRLRFGHDSWGSGEVTSDPVATDLTKPHVLEVQMGSLYPPGQTKEDDRRERNQLAVWLDGKLVLSGHRPFNPSPASEVVFGYNAIGASSAVGMFTGTVLKTRRVPWRALSVAPEVWGPIQLTLRFPADIEGDNEPLVVTGESGACDTLYVRYLDANHIQFGLDHWGKGGTLSPPIPLDYAKVHRLEIVMGSLYPPSGHAAWKGHAVPPEGFRQKVEIRLDGDVVYSIQAPLYAASPDEVAIGKNDVNATTCLRVFSGHILHEGREAW